MNNENTNGNVNREYKSTLFCLIFGTYENRHWTLDLYNAINGSHYTNPDDIEFNTLKDAMYMGIKNDVSFILDSFMNLYEHQSTFNPNMPLRQLEYVTNLYEEYLAKYNLDKYSSRKIIIPLPKLLVFYNGTKEEPEETILQLSDLFPAQIKNVEADVKVTTKMLNINYDCNKELLDACKPLSEYSWVVDTERRHSKYMSPEKAVEKTLEEMPDDFQIKPFLVANKKVVTSSFLTEYDEEFHINCEKQISFEEGQATERVNTEREKARADAAEAEVERLKKMLAEKQ